MVNNPKYQEFLIEAEDMIQSLTENLQTLQSSSVSSDQVNPDVINTLFRGMHTLKGMASVTGFSRIATLSHKLEDLLDDLRFDRIRLTINVIDTLFEGIDALFGLLKAISEDGSECVEIDSVVEKIEKTTREGVMGSEISPIEIPYISPDLLKGLSDYETHRLRENLKSGASLYRIKAVFGINTINEDISTVKAKLLGFGEVIGFIPLSGFSSEKGMTLEIIFASKEDKIEERLSNITEGNIVKDITAVYTSVPISDQPDQSAIATTATADSGPKSLAPTVKVGVERLDSLLNTVGEMFLLNDVIFQAMKDIKTEQGNNRSMLDASRTVKELSKKLSILRDDLIDVRMVPVGYMFNRLSYIVDKLCKDLSKGVKVVIRGEETKLDKSMVEWLADPLMHIIRNAVYHGIENGETRLGAGKPETGTISLKAFQRDSRVFIEVEDDGSGIDFKNIHAIALEKCLINKGDEPDERKLIQFLFRPGFSTSKTINEVSGRGVGLDVVAKNIACLGGIIDVETKSGQGTKFSITLPLTLLITKALIVMESDRSFAIPFNSISENLILREKDLKRMGGKEVFNLRGQCIPIVRLKEILEFNNKNNPPFLKGDMEGLSSKDDKKYLIVVGIAEKRAGIVVDSINGQRVILIKPMNELIGGLPGVSGFTEIGAKRILPVLDVGGIIGRCKIV